MGEVLVVGYGSELRRDDAVGRRVAEEIERADPAGVTVRSITQLVPELVELLARNDRAVFIDAAIDTTETSVRQVRPRAASGRSHHADPAHLLSLMMGLDLPVPEVFVVSVPAHDLTFGEGLTDETARHVPVAVTTVMNLIGAPPEGE